MDNFRRNLLVNKKSGGEFVDLGLPSGLKWAKGNLKKSGETCVIGEETDYGDFWSWANVGLTNDTGWMSSEGGEMTQKMYNSTLGHNLFYDMPVNATYDTARYHLGAPWRLPTQVEFQELYNNTNREWTSIDGIYGQKFKKKTDPNVYIFFPASGNCDSSGLNYRGLLGYYWSSECSDSYKAYHLFFSMSSVSTYGNGDRYCGFSVRPVQ